MAYLRKVASTTNATIAPSVSAGGGAACTRRRHDSTRRGSRLRSDDDNNNDSDSSETSYFYDYLRVPPRGVLRSPGGRSKAASARHSNVRLQRPSASMSAARPSRGQRKAGELAAADEKQEDALQLSFAKMYAALREAGAQEVEAAAASRRTTYRGRPGSSPSRSGPACFRHSWAGSSLTIRVPPIPAESKEANRARSGTQARVPIAAATAESTGKAPASTDISANTSGSTKLTSSTASSASSSDDDASSPLMSTTKSHRDISHRQQRQQQQRQRTDSSLRFPSARFACPLCCRRCDSCHCVGRPCQRSDSRAARRDATGQAEKERTPQRRSSPELRKHKSGSPSHLDTVRLKWPNQPEVHEPRLVPLTTTATQALASLSAPKPQSIRNQHQHHQRGRRSTSEEEKDETAADKNERATKETALRNVAVRVCTCYWSDFPDLTIAINPASHAATCPYQAQHALYDEFMTRFNSSRSAGGAEFSSILSSSNSSSSSYSVESPTQRPVSNLRGRWFNRGTTRSAQAATSVHEAARKALTHEEELEQLEEQRRQRRRWLAEEEAAAKKKVRGRAAVIGSAVRRTYMEQIMSAARDSPSPTRKTTAAAAKPAEKKRQSGLQPHRAGPSLSTAGDAEVTITPAHVAVAAAGTTSEAVDTPKASQEAKDEKEEAADRHEKATEGDVENEKAVVEHDEQPEEQPGTDAVQTEMVGVVEAREEDDRKGEEEPAATPVLPQSVVEEPAETDKDESSPLRALSRPRLRPAVGVPGPGAYEVDAAYASSSSVHAVRGAAMPKAARMPPIKSITPGPGAYKVYGESSRTKEDSAATAEDDDKKTASMSGAAESADAPEPAPQPLIIGKGVVFCSSSARQFQLQFGVPFQRDATWAKQVAAVPGPGAYNIMDGDRIDQSRPLGTAKMGFQFARSSDGAHFTGLVSSAAAAAATSVVATTEAADAATQKATPTGFSAAAPVVPWRDWAGGAYIGTSTTAFWAHPSLAGGGRRALPRRGEKAEDGDAEENVKPLATRGAEGAAAEAAAAKNAGGGAWHGVGSGVALRLTSQRFPVQNSSPYTTSGNAPGSANAKAAGQEDAQADSPAAAMERLRQSRGEPGPASYETEAALKWIQKRAPEVSMTFKHDRGPRGPLQSTSAAGMEGVESDNNWNSSSSNAAIAASPGPGSYDVVASDLWGPRRSPQWSFGTAARLPGIATVPPNAEAAALSESNRRSYENGQGGEEVPGPGAYYTDAGYRMVRPSSSSAVMGAAPRFQGEAGKISDGFEGYLDDEDSTRVGPGTYDVDTAYNWLLYRVKGGALPRAGGQSGRTRRRSGGRSIYNTDPSYTTVEESDADDEAVPGPGAYTLPPLPVSGPTAYLGSTAPRFPWERLELEQDGSLNWTSGTRAVLLSDLTPGPGAYDVDAAARLARRPGTVIGRAPRSSFLVSTSGSGLGTSGEVGPGSYDLPSLPVGRSVVMSYTGNHSNPRQSPLELFDRDVPGPGLYDPVDLRAAAPRSFSLARTGPRFVNGAVTSATGLLVSGGVRDDGTPGPGAYDVDAQVRVAAFSLAGGSGGPAFGTAPRFISSDHGDDPGHFGQGGGDAAGGGTSTVGPGSYDPHPADASSAPTYSFPRGPRFPAHGGSSLSVDNSGGGDGGGVGPGAYEIVDLSPPTRSAIMGSAIARPYLPNGDPAAYSNGAYANGSGADVPGPGAYSPQYAQVEKSVPQVALARAGAATPPHGAEGSGLGPGQYDPQYPSDVTQSTHAYTFSSAPRAANEKTREEAEVPGPGAYEVRVTRDGQRVESNSGGAMGAGYPFGTAPRHAGSAGPLDPSFAADVPGPGTYTPEAYTDMASRALLRDGAAPRIGTAPRTSVGADEARVDAGPGPGAYDPSLYAGTATAGPFITFPRAARSHTPATEAEAVPGPGAYAPENYDNSLMNLAGQRSAQFGSAARFPAAAGSAEGGVVDDVPGPNAYSPDDAAVRAAVPAYRFGTAAAHADGIMGSGVEKGGSGAANPSSTLEWFASDSAVPGPGAYDISRAHRWMQSSGGAETAHRFGTAARFGGENAGGTANAAGSSGADGGSVGPGAYDVASGLARTSQMPTTAAYSFPRAAAHGTTTTTAAAAEAGEGSPGPGAYSLDAGFRATLPRAAVAILTGAVTGRGEDADGATSNGKWAQGGAASGAAAGAAAAARGEAMPGPGAYQLPSAFPEGPQWGFGTAPRYAYESDGSGLGEDASGIGSRASATGATVGPGSYAVPPPPPLHGGVTVPRAFTDHVGKESSVSPGPGAYDVSDSYQKSLLSAAAGGVRIGTAPRYPADAYGDGGGETSSAGVKGPGPGAYSPNVDASSHTAGTGARAGPTFPQAPRMMSTNATAKGGDADTAAMVGPGSYDLPFSMTMGSAAAPRFGTAPRMSPSVTSAAATAGEEARNVGPGSYAIANADGQVLPRAPAHHIISTRDYRNIDSTASYGAARDGAVGAAGSSVGVPGPGSYDVPIEVQAHARAALLLGRPADSVDLAAREHATPGPGSYDPPLSSATAGGGVTASGPAHRFGTAPTHRLSPPSSFGGVEGGGTSGYASESVTPGPGAYDSAAAFCATQTRGPASAGVTMLGRPATANRELERRSAEPGPGAYDVAASVQGGTAPAYRFGTAPRMPASADSESEGGVGPGAYDTSAVYESSGSGGGGHMHYGAGPSISFSQAPRMWSLEQAEAESLPGPGAYDVAGGQRDVAGPSYTIPRGPRPPLRTGDADASPMVGPGSYTPAKGWDTSGGVVTASAVTIGLAPRVWSAGNADTPGPGSYHAEAPSLGGPSGPSFCCAGRPDVVQNSNPGPGTYDPPAGAATAAATARSGSVGVSFGSAARPGPELRTSATPGPGAYDIEASSFSHSIMGRETSGPSFGSSTRPTAVLNDNPGPGTYETANRAGSTGPAAAFGFGERPGPIVNDNPSPGAYYSMRFNVPDGPAAGFGFGERPSPVVNTNPGPGAYYHEPYMAHLTDVPSSSFGRAERPSPALNNHNPGPGAYYCESWAETFDRSTFALAGRPAAARNTATPGPGAYFRGVDAPSACTPARGVSIGTSERPDQKLTDDPGTAKERSANAQRKRSKRPTAADTLRKLASVGYPLDPKN